MPARDARADHLTASHNALISPGSTMNPRDIAVFFEPPSPNQSRSFKKKTFGIPTREMRDAGPTPLPEARLKMASKAPIKESIIALEQMDGAVECVPAETICH